ncbi:DNA cytosine methyltransferase [Vreelandella rituensis]|nr:DNA cytosine methyltransferase [Halomonas rituensis]
MATLIQTTISENRGQPRLWIEGGRLAREGLAPGMILSGRIQDGQLIFAPANGEAPANDSEFQVTVSRRKRGDKITPLLEVRLPILSKLFGLAARVVVKLMRGKLCVSRHHQDVKIKERERSLVECLEGGQSLKIASLYHGGGGLDCALHEGLEKAGIESYCALASEIEGKYMDASLANNPHLFRDDSLILNAPVEQLQFANSGAFSVHALVGGVPCTGASSAGKAKLQLAYAEQHPSAGAQFFAFLKMIELTNPAICILENVCQYRNTPSYAIILSVLKTLGYRVSDRDLNGNIFGALENRDRMAMVAVSEGLPLEFDIEAIPVLAEKPAALAEVLEPAEAVEERFRDYDYLRIKEERDRKAGKGFMRQLLTPDAVSVPTITRDYNKVRSTDPQLAHPSDPVLTRLFTPLEHARIKGIPERIIKNLADTTAHQILGQSVIYPAFMALGYSLGHALRRLVSAAQKECGKQPAIAA